MAWQDQNLIQLTITIHQIAEASNIYEIKRIKRSGIKLFSQLNSNKLNSNESNINNDMIGMCVLAYKYNIHIKGLDSNV